jgi:hypothetical protein
MLTLDKIQVPTEAPMFNERKATEAALMLVAGRGVTDNLLRVLAELYVADRRLIAGFGRGLTDDTFLALHGILAVPLGVLNHAAKTNLFLSTWHTHIESFPVAGEGYKVKILASLEPTVLSDMERQIIEAVAADYSALTDEAFFERLAAEAPEIRTIGDGRFTLKDVLISLGDDADEASEVSDHWESERRTRYGAGSLSA